MADPDDDQFLFLDKKWKLAATTRMTRSASQIDAPSRSSSLLRTFSQKHYNTNNSDKTSPSSSFLNGKRSFSQKLCISDKPSSTSKLYKSKSSSSRRSFSQKLCISDKPSSTSKLYKSKSSSSRCNCSSCSILPTHHSYSTTAPGSRLMRSSSLRITHHCHINCSCSLLTTSFPRKGSQFTRRCRDVVKEHNSRFYIIRRCVSMLLCSGS